MKKQTLISSILFLSTLPIGVVGIPVSSAHAITGPSNYWECIIDRMVDAKTDRDATSIRKQCRWDFPDFYWRRAADKSHGFLGFFTESQTECMTDNMKETRSRLAKEELRQACRALFRP